MRLPGHSINADVKAEGARQSASIILLAGREVEHVKKHHLTTARAVGALALILASWPEASAALEVNGVLDVTVGNVRSAHGEIRVALCTRDTFLKPDCPYAGHVPAAIGSVVVRLQGIRPGIYAVQALHHEDGSGQMVFSFLGVPEKGFGFSRNARTHLGPPALSDSAFALTGGSRLIAFKLRYFD